MWKNDHIFYYRIRERSCMDTESSEVRQALKKDAQDLQVHMLDIIYYVKFGWWLHQVVMSLAQIIIAERFYFIVS